MNAKAKSKISEDTQEYIRKEEEKVLEEETKMQDDIDASAYTNDQTKLSSRTCIRKWIKYWASRERSWRMLLVRMIMN